MMGKCLAYCMYVVFGLTYHIPVQQYWQLSLMCSRGKNAYFLHTEACTGIVYFSHLEIYFSGGWLALAREDAYFDYIFLQLSNIIYLAYMAVEVPITS